MQEQKDKSHGDSLLNKPQEFQKKRIKNYSFSFNQLLGKGNFSKVYRGLNQDTSQQVAIKIVELSTINSSTMIELLNSQIQILKKIKHPNVLKFHEVLTTQNNCYIITQLCSGDLETVIRNSPHGYLEQKEIYNIAYDIFKALMYLYNSGVVHRDIKVANIFQTENISKLADFGFAKLTRSNFIDISIGSPIYMAPEGLIKNVYGPKTDIWAYGVLLYELTHGIAPCFKCRNQYQLKKQLNKQIEKSQLKQSLSDEFKELIVGCLNIDHKKRYSIQDVQQSSWIKKIKNLIQGSQKLQIINSGIKKSNTNIKQIQSQENQSKTKIPILSENFKNKRITSDHHNTFSEEFNFKKFNPSETAKCNFFGANKSNQNQSIFKPSQNFIKLTQALPTWNNSIRTTKRYQTRQRSMNPKFYTIKLNDNIQQQEIFLQNKLLDTQNLNNKNKQESIIDVSIDIKRNVMNNFSCKNEQKQQYSIYDNTSIFPKIFKDDKINEKQNLQIEENLCKSMKIEIAQSISQVQIDISEEDDNLRIYQPFHQITNHQKDKIYKTNDINITKSVKQTDYRRINSEEDHKKNQTSQKDQLSKTQTNFGFSNSYLNSFNQFNNTSSQYFKYNQYDEGIIKKSKYFQDLNLINKFKTSNQQSKKGQIKLVKMSKKQGQLKDLSKKMGASEFIFSKKNFKQTRTQDKLMQSILSNKDGQKVLKVNKDFQNDIKKKDNNLNVKIPFPFSPNSKYPQQLTANYLPGGIQFLQCIGILHYCRLLYKFITIIRQLYPDKDIDLLKNWLMSMLKNLNQKVIRKEVTYSRLKNVKQAKLKNVLQQYTNKYSNELFKQQQPKEIKNISTSATFSKLKSIFEEWIEFIYLSLLNKSQIKQIKVQYGVPYQQQVIMLGFYVLVINYATQKIIQCQDYDLKTQFLTNDQLNYFAQKLNNKVINSDDKEQICLIRHNRGFRHFENNLEIQEVLQIKKGNPKLTISAYFQYKEKFNKNFFKERNSLKFQHLLSPQKTNQKKLIIQNKSLYSTFSYGSTLSFKSSNYDKFAKIR